ncbi:LSM domain-containing protein [Apiospora arundinis]
MSFMPINPRPMLQDLYVSFTAYVLPLRPRLPPSRERARTVNKDIVVRLKWGETEYKGRLVSIDSYMNIQLTGAQEFIDQKFTSDLGQILIRCNNVLWIKGAGQGEGGADVKMDG